MKTRRVLSILGVLFLAGLLVMSWSVWSLVRAVRSAASGSAITISEETTFIESPLDDEGNVDYVAALNQLSSEDVTAENNAVVLFWRAFGPEENVSDPFFEMIGMERPPKEGSKFSSIVKSAIAERSVRTVIARTIGRMMFSLFQGGYPAVLDGEDRVKSYLDVTRLAFALAVYHAERGEYPENLAELCPDYLAEIPKDLFAEGDFRYALNDAGYLLYGVGQNGRDEGGRNHGMDYGHLDDKEIPADAEMETDDIAIRVPAERF